jgi:hypothetical protein
MKKKGARKVSSAKKPRTNNNPLKWFLSISFALTVVLVLLRIYYPPQSADVFLIGEPQLTYGETSVTGQLGQSDSAFILDLGNNILVELDVNGIESLVGKQVVVSGNLTIDEYGNNVMEVREIQAGEL